MIDLVCYCFEYSREDIEQDVLNNGRSLIVEVRRVVDGINGKADSQGSR